MLRWPTGKEIASTTVPAGLAIAWTAAVFPGFFPAYMEIPCKDQQEAAEEYCGVHHVVPYLLFYGFDFLERHGDAFVALATIAIGIFTFTLWNSTHRLWQASTEQLNLARATERRQTNYAKGERKLAWENMRIAAKSADAALLNAKAAIGMELPIIRAPRTPGLIGLAGPPAAEDFAKGGIFIQGVPGQYSLVVGLEFHNLGRTPAFPIRLDAGWQVISDLPAEPNYFISVPCLPTAIISGDGGEFSGPRIQAAVELTAEEQDLLRGKTALLWLYVSLRYRDFLNQHHEARFCWSGRGRFGLGGNPPTAYATHT